MSWLQILVLVLVLAFSAGAGFATGGLPCVRRCAASRRARQCRTAGGAR